MLNYTKTIEEKEFYMKMSLKERLKDLMKDVSFCGF